MSIEEMRILRERVLSDCPNGKEFWTCHGSIVKNIYELKNSIRSLNKFAFKYHVNEDRQKNDFADWIADVLDDTELANRLREVLDKKIFVELIEDRIKELESV